jgi:sRNA-binding protein
MNKSSPLYKAVVELDKELSEKYPAYAENKPLEIGTYALLLGAGYDVFGNTLKRCIARHCNRSDYLFNMLSGEYRYDMFSGKPVDKISDQSKAHAIEILKRIEKNRIKRGGKNG